MNAIFPITVLVTCCVVAVVFYRWLCRFSERSPSDVLPFLHQFDLETMYGTFHPEAEELLRQKLAPEEFKEIQWKRFHLGIHYCKLLAANSRVLQEWTLYGRRKNWQDFTPGLQETVLELRNRCMQCRLAAFVIRLRLRWWLARMRLLPWTSPPSFSRLLRLGSAEMIAFYDQVRAAAELFSLAYGDDYHRKLMQVL